jgi:hypothetical protein
MTMVLTPPDPEQALQSFLESLQADDRAKGTIRCYKSATLGFLSWYRQEEHRPLTLDALTPISLVGYRNFLQCSQRRATSTVNGQMSGHLIERDKTYAKVEI